MISNERIIALAFEALASHSPLREAIQSAIRTALAESDKEKDDVIYYLRAHIRTLEIPVNS